MQGIPDLTGTRVVGQLRVNRRAAPGRDTQKGADPAETARRVEMALRTFGAGPDDPPTWVAAVVRRARDGERRRVLAWYSARLGAANPVHHAGDMDSVVISLLAGGSGRGEVRQRLNQVAAALPGFDVGVRVRILTPWPAAAGALAVAALLGGFAVWAFRVAPAAARPGLPPALLAALLLVLAALLAAVPLRRHAVRARVRRGEFPVPGRCFAPRPRRTPAAGRGGAAGAAVPVAGHGVPGRARAADRAGGAARRGRVRRGRHPAPGSRRPRCSTRGSGRCSATPGSPPPRCTCRPPTSTWGCSPWAGPAPASRC